jgi:hypothetical protein
VVTVQCLHDADARKHRRSAVRRDQDQGFHGRLPFRRRVLSLRKLRDVERCVAERDELLTLRRLNRLVEGPGS